MTEHDRLKRWMERRGLSVEALAEATGYGPRAVYWMLRGETPPNPVRKKPGKVAPWVWQRFKVCCAGVEAQLRSGKKFDW